MKIRILAIFALLLLTSGLKVHSQDFNIQTFNEEPQAGQIIKAKVWKKVKNHKTFHAPWSKKSVENEFKCYFSDNYFYFCFKVLDKMPVTVEPFTQKLDVAPEDRAEIFLSPTSDMQEYYCAEMDPKGRCLDYSAKFKRVYNYGWSFETLHIEASSTNYGYIVAGRWALSEWQKLNIDPNHFYMGVFSADFYAPKKVIWYSLLERTREHADFHIPEMLFKCGKQAGKENSLK